MDYYLVELNDWEQVILSEKEIIARETLAKQFNGFVGYLVLKKLTPDEIIEWKKQKTQIHFYCQNELSKGEKCADQCVKCKEDFKHLIYD